MAQVEEVVRALDLGRDIEPYTRCLECNGVVESVHRREVVGKVPLQVFIVYRDFKRCETCERVYWRGSHTRRLEKVIERARAVSGG
jgi:uncharacterized protein with PIN domain